MDSQGDTTDIGSDEAETSWEEIREQFENRVDRLGSADSESDAESDGPTESNGADDGPPAGETVASDRTGESKPEPERRQPDRQATPRDTPSPEQGDSAVTERSSADAASRPTNEPSTITSPRSADPPTRKSEYDDVEAFNPDRSEGNLTQIYRATHPDIDRPVVLKGPFDRSTLGREGRQAILDEARTWQRFADADHVVTLLNSSDSLEHPLIVMEYMDGGSLTERLGDLSVEQALWTGIGITHGVYSAHRNAVQHLDIKPSNILFRSVDGAWDVPKVADWGTSRTVTDSGTSDAFTAKYAAPEQYLNEYPRLADRHDIDWGQFGGDATEIDQYQIGLVLYELLTGEYPYDTTDHTIADAKFEQEPRPPSELVDPLPPTIDEPLMKALRTEPWRRHSDLVILMTELARVYDSIVDREVSLNKIKYDGWTTGN